MYTGSLFVVLNDSVLCGSLRLEAPLIGALQESL